MRPAFFFVAHLESVLSVGPSASSLCKTPIHSAGEAILPCDDAATRICCVQKLSANLGGGNSNMFYFHPEPWGNDPIGLVFFKWVETTNK